MVKFFNLPQVKLLFVSILINMVFSFIAVRDLGLIYNFLALSFGLLLLFLVNFHPKFLSWVIVGLPLFLKLLVVLGITDMVI